MCQGLKSWLLNVIFWEGISWRRYLHPQMFLSWHRVYFIPVGDAVVKSTKMIDLLSIHPCPHHPSACLNHCTVSTLCPARHAVSSSLHHPPWFNDKPASTTHKLWTSQAAHYIAGSFNQHISSRPSRLNAAGIVYHLQGCNTLVMHTWMHNTLHEVKEPSIKSVTDVTAKCLSISV